MWEVYVKAGLVLVVMAALSDGSKVVVSAVPGYRESTENWSVLRDIKRRGLSCPRLVERHWDGELCATSIRRRQSNAAGTTRS